MCVYVCVCVCVCVTLQDRASVVKNTLICVQNELKAVTVCANKQHVLFHSSNLRYRSNLRCSIKIFFFCNRIFNCNKLSDINSTIYMG